ncbi:MAG: hypothetical protein WC955_10630 [Elusimicrobiota bacterium]
MKHVYKFKTFAEHNAYVLSEQVNTKFDYKRAVKFFKQFGIKRKCPYPPGVYKFKTFAAARKFDLKMRVLNSKI